MANTFVITLDTAAVHAALNRLLAAATDPLPALTAIGEYLHRSTDSRFSAQTAPDGSRWRPNTRTTLERYFDAHNRTGKLQTKSGRINSRGVAVMSGKKVLEGKSKMLRHQLTYRLLGTTGVELLSTLPYAAMQQFGGQRSRYPHLWGDIPARPFMGISAQDQSSIVSILRDSLLR